jgi:uncharacterized protein
MRTRVVKWLWLSAGVLSLGAGIVGLVLPVMPTVPFVILAAYCFARGSKRWETWLLMHKTFGPMVNNWRTNRSVPLRAKQLSTLMMAASSALSWWYLPHYRWVPAVFCAAVAIWLWRLPTAAPKKPS